MLMYLVGKRSTKTSKQIMCKDSQGNEENFLVNVENFDDIVVNKVVELELDDKTWNRMRIVKSITSASDEMLEKMYGPKKVPTLRSVVTRIVDYINKTPDQSNIGGGPRHVEVEDMLLGLRNFLVDGTDGTKAQRFMKCPASTKYHDSQEGGLLRHISKMVTLWIGGFESAVADGIEYEQHPLALGLGILFHDLGKLDSYELTENGYEVTEESRYLGYHLAQGFAMWAEKGKSVLRAIKVPNDEVDKMYKDVLHMIGSHHGPVKNGTGSIVDPFGHDAWTLHALDLLESQQEEGIKPVRM